jgi:hypothetical protein
MVLGVIVYSGGDGAVPTASPYATAFTVLAGVALAGALACVVLLRDPPPERRPRHHHFRPHF